MSASPVEKVILIVEDEAIIRHDLVDFFEENGFRVFEADTGDSAISLLSDHPSIRIVFTDVSLPGATDGLQLAHFVRERYPPTLLVVTSAVVRLQADELPERAVFLTKPFDAYAVLREIDSLRAANAAP